MDIERQDHNKPPVLIVDVGAEEKSKQLKGKHWHDIAIAIALIALLCAVMTAWVAFLGYGLWQLFGWLTQ